PLWTSTFGFGNTSPAITQSGTDTIFGNTLMVRNGTGIYISASGNFDIYLNRPSSNQLAVQSGSTTQTLFCGNVNCTQYSLVHNDGTNGNYDATGKVLIGGAASNTRID